MLYILFIVFALNAIRLSQENRMKQTKGFYQKKLAVYEIKTRTVEMGITFIESSLILDIVHSIVNSTYYEIIVTCKIRILYILFYAFLQCHLNIVFQYGSY